MWFQSKEMANECESLRDALERTSNGEVTEPISALSEHQRSHLGACHDCRIFADELSQVRQLLRGAADGPQPGPFFMKRVMASIAVRETELESKSQTWAAVPQLASRLTVLASLALLVAGGWLYSKPSQPTVISVASGDQHVESLVDGGAPMQDDLLVNLADR